MAKFMTDIKEETNKIALDTVFSVKGSNNRWLKTLEMNEVKYMKNNNTDLRNISDSLNVRPFNPELPGSWHVKRESDELGRKFNPKFEQYE